MKIVINVCFGGFGLSAKAEKAYAKMKGFELFYYTQTKYSHRDSMVEYTRIENPDSTLFTNAVKKDLGETTDKLPDGQYFSHYNIERTDPDLIAVVEELGEEANGRFSKLKVVEIPDGTDYEISEYDGSEHIAEKHETWS